MPGPQPESRSRQSDNYISVTERAGARAAKDAFNQLDGKVPRIRDLNAEYATILEQKRRDYAEYRTARADMRQLVMARKNIEILLELDENDRQTDREERRQEQQRRNDQQK